MSMITRSVSKGTRAIWNVNKRSISLFSKSKKDLFYCYGLYTDDTISDRIPDVFDAIKRLPPSVYDARQYRIGRAFDLSAKKRILPKDEWTKPEDDISYLMPYVAEVKAEREIEEMWEKFDYNSYLDRKKKQ